MLGICSPLLHLLVGQDWESSNTFTTGSSNHLNPPLEHIINIQTNVVEPIVNIQFMVDVIRQDSGLAHENVTTCPKVWFIFKANVVTSPTENLKIVAETRDTT